MLKLTILLLVLLWVSGFFFGSRKRLIRDVDQLLEYLVWAVLLFVGISAMRQVGLGREPFWVNAAVLCVWGGGTFLLVRTVRLRLGRTARQGERRRK